MEGVTLFWNDFARRLYGHEPADVGRQGELHVSASRPEDVAATHAKRKAWSTEIHFAKKRKYDSKQIF
jgi:hypothetical protein